MANARWWLRVRTCYVLGLALGVVAVGCESDIMSTGSGSGGTSGGGSGTGGVTGSGSGGATGSGNCTPDLTCTLPAFTLSGDPKQDCVDRINQYRTQCACLPALARWTDAEACADQMAEYDSTRDAHAGFTGRICTPGGTSENECPGWRSNEQIINGCLAQMWAEGPPPTSSCSGQCYQDHGHFINMTDSTATRVACGFFTTSGGQIWALQNFSR